MKPDWLKDGASTGGFTWHGPQDAHTRRAVIDPERKNKHIWYLERAAQVSVSVARVVFPSGDMFATCFLVGPRLILTNHHVFETEADTNGVKIQFHYREEANGKLRRPEAVDCDASIFITDPALDYTLVGLAGGVSVQPLPLRYKPAQYRNTHVAIIQHPDGEPLQVAMRDNSLVYDDADTVEYLTNTDYGSSGSPVFNDRWQVIALHSQRVQDPDVSDAVVWYRNRGTKIEAILKNPNVDALIPH